MVMEEETLPQTLGLQVSVTDNSPGFAIPLHPFQRTI
jgi:hypothetical protein